jgi:hypothetical protein
MTSGRPAEFRDLHTVLDDDRVFADQIDTADMAVEVDADTRPVQPGGNLFDMGRLAGAMETLDQQATVMRKGDQNRERGVVIETIRVVEIRHMFGLFREGRNLHIDINVENFPRGYRGIRQVDFTEIGDNILGLGSHSTPFLQRKHKLKRAALRQALAVPKCRIGMIDRF